MPLLNRDPDDRMRAAHESQMSDIFISYTRADKESAQRLAEVLSARGWSVWWDRDILPGTVYDDTIERALAGARSVIVIWSKNSVSSRWVKTEAADGADRGILVPVLIDDVPIPLEFRRIEAADLREWKPGSPNPELDSLLKTIERMISAAGHADVRSSPVLKATPAISWRFGQKRIAVGAAVLAAAVFAVLIAFKALGSNGTSDQSVFPGTGAPPTSPTTATATANRPGPGTGAAPPAPETTASAPVNPAGNQAAAAPISGQKINLLASENGGHVVTAPNKSWASTIDGKEEGTYRSVGDIVSIVREVSRSKSSDFQHTVPALHVSSGDSEVSEIQAALVT